MDASTVRITLPSTAAAASSAPPKPDDAVTSPLRILVVDERAVRDVVAELLAAQGLEVMQEPGGPEGLAYLDRGIPLDLVLTTSACAA